MGANQQSIVLLLGAKSKHRPLPAIPEELSTLKSIFEAQQSEDLPQYQIKYEPYFTQKDLKTWLDGFADHIAILHFAGHSDPTSIQTEDSFVRAEDIAAHIKTWTRRPDLVFLNGCENKSQAQIFLDAGVSAVVATRRAVNDRQAANFAQEFYRSLLAQNGNTSLAASLQQAKAKLGFDQSDESRSSNIDEEEAETASWNWELLLKDTGKAHLSLHKLLTFNRPRYDAAGELINPYQGLAAFKEEDRDFFFGREQLTEQLVSTIDQTPFLALLGSSGSGKSSLINAGIIPRLRESEDYLIFKTRPGNDPFAEMARCIAEYLYPEREELDQRIEQAETLTKKFQKNPKYLSKLLQTCLQDSDKPRLVLFIDQFEELFTHTDSEAAKEAVKQYEMALAELVTTANGTITVVLAMRADFLGTALTHPQLAVVLDQYSQHTKYLSPMSSAELRSVILEPAAKQGVSVEDGLTDQLLSELEKNTESLPLLQHVLSLVWESRDSSILKLIDYTRLGGIETALETQADQFLDGLSENEKTHIKRIFLRLINLGDGQEDTRRRADKTEFSTDPEVNILLQQLAKQRLVATQGDNSQNAFVEISHEALIKSWGKLRGWVQENRDQLRIQHRISQEAKDWFAHDEDESWLLTGSRLTDASEWLKENEALATEAEKTLIRISKSKEKKRKNRLIYSATTVIAFLTGFAIFAAYQWIIANEEKLDANYNLAKAHEQKSLLSISQGDDLTQASSSDTNADNKYRNALLYALEAQRRPLAKGKVSLSQTSLGQISTLQESALHTSSLETPNLSIGNIYAVAYRPDGKVIASGSSDKTIKLWDAKTGELIKALEGHEGKILTLTYSPDGKFIASGSSDNTVRLWNAQSYGLIRTLKGHSDNILALAFSPDSDFIVSGSADKTMRTWDVISFEPLRVFKGHTNSVKALSYSPNGKIIASGSKDKTIRIWDSNTGDTIKSIDGRHTDSINTLVYSPDGLAMVTGSDDGTIKFWDPKSFGLLKNIRSRSGDILALSYKSNGKIIAAGSTDGSIGLWNTQTFEPIKTLKASSNDILTIAYQPHSDVLSSGSDDNTIRLWNTKSGVAINTIKGHSRTVMAVTYSPDGKFVASGSADNTIRIWGAQSLNHIKTLHGHTGFVRTLAYSPDGKVIASGSEDTTIQLWDALSFERISTLKGHTETVRTISFSPNGEAIASGSNDNTIRLWNTKSFQNTHTLKAHSDHVTTLAFSPSGKVIASGSNDNSIQFWDMLNFENIHTIKEHSEIIKVITYSPNGEMIAAGFDKNAIRLWDTESFEAIKTLEGGHTKKIRTLSFSPDNKTIASGSDDHTIQLWNIQSGKAVNTLKGHSGGVLQLAYSPDGNRIISGSADNSMRMWNSLSSKSKNILKAHSKKVSVIAYSPDGKTIATGSKDNTIRIWNAKSGEVIQTLEGHKKAVFALVYSPDGMTLASGSADNTIRIWNTQTGKEAIKPLKDHSQTILALAYSPDGSKIASGSADNTIRIWDTQSYELIDILTGHSLTVLALAFSPDGKVLASGSSDRTIQVWNTQTLDKIKTIDGHSDSILALSFSPDNKFLTSGSADNTIRLWDAINFKHFRTLTDHSSYVRSIAYSTNSAETNVLVSGSDDNTIKLWETESFNNIETLTEPSSNFSTLALSPDGIVVASGFGNNIRLWRLTSPMFRFINHFSPREVSGALLFLWELELKDLNFEPKKHPQSLIPQMGHHIAWTNKTSKYHTLLNAPEADKTKMDQVVSWLIKRCAYKHPKRYECAPMKD